MKICDIIKKIEKEYKKSLAYDFDNSGLNVGKDNNDVKGIVVCLDVTNEVIDFAIKNNANFIISHHPMLFFKLKNIDEKRIDTIKVIRLIENNITAYSMHTNFDVTSKIGMGDIAFYNIFSKSDIKKEKYLEKIDNKNGLGKIASMKKKYSINDVVEKISKKFNINRDILRVYTKNDIYKKYIDTIAMLPGSGKSMVNTIIEMNAQLYISGDLSHDNILDLMEKNIAYIDCTHYGLEKIFVDYMYRKLNKLYKNAKIFKVYNNYM